MNTTLVNLRTTANSATHEGHRHLLPPAAPPRGLSWASGLAIASG